MSLKPDSLPDPVWESVTDPGRRDVLAALSVLDSRQDADFDRLTALAASIFEAPMALITLVDTEWQWFRSHHGTDIDETPVGASFCAHTIADRDAPWMVVADALADPRFADNALVKGPPFVRFYAGAPITVRGQRLGALCVLSPEPRARVDETRLKQLTDLAAMAASLFELKEEARVRARTAADLIREEWRHALTLEAGKVGSWVWDLRSNEVVMNDIMRRVFDLPGQDKVAVGQMFAAIRPEDLPGVEAAFRKTFEDGVDYSAEFRTRATDRWLAGRGRVYQRDANGEPLVIMGVNVDITESRLAADQTRLLLRELNHRVKNTLAMIQSLARQTMRRSPDPRAFMEAFSGRLRTLSDAHALLADRDWLGIRLREVIRSAVGPYASDPAQVVVEGDDIHLPPDHALGLGLTLHELASNASRYGALSVPEGRVTIGWREETGPRRLVLTWRENGGPEVREPTERGFGSQLIARSLDKVIDSRVQVDFAPEGVNARIDLPLAEVV